MKPPCNPSILGPHLSTVQMVGQEWPAWGMMWGSVCGWRFYCQRHFGGETKPWDRSDVWKMGMGSNGGLMVV